jgi:hypothetical protein
MRIKRAMCPFTYLVERRISICHCAISRLLKDLDICTRKVRREGRLALISKMVSWSRILESILRQYCHPVVRPSRNPGFPQLDI